MAVYYLDQAYDCETLNKFDYNVILNGTPIEKPKELICRIEQPKEIKVYNYKNVFIILGPDAYSFFHKDSVFEKNIGTNCKKIIIKKV